MAGVGLSKLLFGHPVIAILGCTGTGKSKLAIELAKRFNGEVINADAMQMYAGLDIITNKVTEEEQDGIPHHLLGFLNPLKKLTVCEYKNLALSKIKEIIDRRKLPIIVGGTFYYVESILYDFIIGSSEFATYDKVEDILEGTAGEKSPRKKLKIEEYYKLEAELDQLDNEELHERLGQVDPELAKKTHPNSRRKLLRGIMVYYQHGEPLSSILEKQRSQPGGCSTGGPLRFPNAIMLWLQCDSAVLKERLNQRVNSMLSRGLVNELLEFDEATRKQYGLMNHTTKGIFQSIGYKEFQKFLHSDEAERESEEGKKSFDEGVEHLRIATRQYANQQIKWMRNRFLRNGQRQLPPIYSLDVTDPAKWDENVYKIAENILECHLDGKKPSVEPLPVENSKVVVDMVYKCECGTLLSGRYQYDIHLKSNKHVKNMKKKQKLEKQNEERAVQENSSIS